MLTIGVIEDEKRNQEQTVIALHKWSQETGETIRVKEYKDAKSFFFDFEDGESFDVLIMDIILPASVAGTEIARRVRERDKRVIILFLTQVTDSFQDGFEVSALQYLIKPLIYPLLRRSLDRAAAQLRETEVTYYTFNHGKGKMMRLAHDDILFIESQSQHVIIHTADGQRFDDWSRLKDVEKELPAGFVRTHRSYIVNLHHVDRLEYRSVFVGQEELPVSRTYLDRVRREWSDIHRLL